MQKEKRVRWEGIAGHEGKGEAWRGRRGRVWRETRRRDHMVGRQEGKERER